MSAKNPFTIFEQWLEWLDSHDGRLYRRRNGDKEDDSDFLARIPTPPGSSIFTVGDLRALVEEGKTHPITTINSPPTIDDWRNAAEACRTRLAQLSTTLQLNGRGMTKDELWEMAESLEPTIAIVDQLARREGR